ncbi:MAG: UDPGP type 1 family protein, partial [Lachnospiraceae bacterium]|nr:UDPGP type 1 family protein [Lachnospiraceae bacterium]
MDYQNALKKLDETKQAHLLAYYNELTPASQVKLLKQIEEIDFSVLDSLKNHAVIAGKGVIEPLNAMELDEINARKDDFTAIGIQAIKQGKVGAVLLAGGMGT